jgi:hypothetical protein
MSKSYLNHKENKRKFAVKLVIFLIVLAVIFSVALIRLANTGTSTDVVNNPPRNEDVYTMAKEFIRPGIKSSYISFPETGYQFAQTSDSTYTIKSYMESKNQSGEKSVTPFVITLQFYGGDARNKKRWKMISLIKN